MTQGTVARRVDQRDAGAPQGRCRIQPPVPPVRPSPCNLRRPLHGNPSHCPKKSSSHGISPVKKRYQLGSCPSRPWQDYFHFLSYDENIREGWQGPHHEGTCHPCSLTVGQAWCSLQLLRAAGDACLFLPVGRWGLPFLALSRAFRGIDLLLYGGGLWGRGVLARRLSFELSGG